MAVFKAYDIRAKYPKEINEDLFEKIGNNLHILDNPKKIIIGHDMRKSSKSLKDALIKGIITSGIDVIDIGLATTPMLYQSTHDFDVDLGVIITASHNSKEYNGMKVCKKNAFPVSFDTGLNKIEQAVKNNKQLISKFKGNIETIYNYLEKYESYLKTFLNPSSKLKVVIDCGNGMAGLDTINILKDKVDLIELYTDLDGTFPNHEANPIIEENLEDLQKEVLKHNADIGLAFDGDADRLGVIDNKGNYVPADLIGSFLTHHFILQKPNEQNYAYDLRSSKIFEDTIVNNNKTPHKTRVGHSYIKKVMRETNSYFAAELSGHFYFNFKEDLIYDSAIRASIELINAITTYNKSIYDLLEKYRKYIHSPEINFKIEDKEKTLKNIENTFKNLKQEKLDGISIYNNNWWCNLRVSNTENLLRLNLEADTKEIYNQKLKELKALISK